MASFFSSLFSKNNKADYAVALDIGTAVVKALILKVDKNKEKGYVVGAGKIKQKIADMHAGAVTNIDGVVRCCREAIREAQKDAKILPDQTILGIAGELVKGQTVTIHYERLKPRTKIDFKELQKILEQVQWQSFDKIRKQLSFETGINELDVKLINSVVVDVRIDGYKVTNPISFQGKDVSISIFNAYAPLVHLGALQTIASELNLDVLSVAAEPYAVARCVAEEDEYSAIFIDIGGGTSDIAVVRSGGIEGTKMFALGGKAFTKRIAQELNIGFQKAEEIKLQYSSGKLDSATAMKVKNILSNDAHVWQSGVELALSEFPANEPLPHKILLCGGGSKLPEIKKALEDSVWQKKLPFAKSPQICFIKPSDVINIIDKTGKLKDQEDITPMGLANLALELAGEEDVLHGILKKTLEVMKT